MRTMSVVIAADGTDASRSATVWAAAEAARRGQLLQVLHVLDWEWSTARYEFSNDRFDADRRHADGIVAQAARVAREAVPAIEVVSDVLVGDPAAQLVAASESAALMVLGDRGRGGFAGLRLGSVSQRVATHARCPVAVIRGGLRSAEALVVAGVDDSAAAGGVLDAAFTAADQRHARLLLVHSSLPPFRGYHGHLSAAESHTPDHDTAARDLLAHQAAPWQARFPAVAVDLLVSHLGPAAALVGAARDAELVIAGSRGHGVLAGTLLGSTGLQLLHYADCPVLIIHPYPKS
ncbi:universal stress protein [Actinoplanes awajinensis]|uniref:UspA domain-containing protein n=1 Tax=Actinoplanes awajinensis subsp. mycoplanecinus TaxID=135947 RepID=A0A124G7P5_9ACTN|nr:universal stress protein [Actinoplanes awajinensis]KUL23471.1 hypothetical protein ADL15_45660 [Actinoplanes awajinensis subsp. mycoplanecinus]